MENTDPTNATTHPDRSSVESAEDHSRNPRDGGIFTRSYNAGKTLWDDTKAFASSIQASADGSDYGPSRSPKTKLALGTLAAAGIMSLAACDGGPGKPPGNNGNDDELVDASTTVQVETAARGLPVSGAEIEMEAGKVIKNATTDSTGEATFTYTVTEKPDSVSLRSNLPNGADVTNFWATKEWSVNLSTSVSTNEIIKDVEYDFSILDLRGNPIKSFIRIIDARGDGNGNPLVLGQEDEGGQHIFQGSFKYGAMTDSVTLQIDTEDPFSSTSLPFLEDLYSKAFSSNKRNVEVPELRKDTTIAIDDITSTMSVYIPDNRPYLVTTTLHFFDTKTNEGIPVSYNVIDKGDSLQEGTANENGKVVLDYLNTQIQGRTEDNVPKVRVNYSKRGFRNGTRTVQLINNNEKDISMASHKHRVRFFSEDQNSNDISDVLVETYVKTNGDSTITYTCETGERFGNACQINFSVRDNDNILPGNFVYHKASKEGYESVIDSTMLGKENELRFKRYHLTEE